MNILEKANELVNGERQVDYGDPKHNHKRIANLWEAYLTGCGIPCCLQPHDVAIMMMLMKVARLMNTPGHEDTWVDIAGYAQVGQWCTEVDKNE